jgi:hypothetical protein
MRLRIDLLALCLWFTGANAQEVEDGCPKDELACHDIINSSQCIAQLVVDQLSPPTKNAMVKCVEFEGTVSNLPGATKVSQGPRIKMNSISRQIKLTAT